ncbi:MAG: ABC transporter ATP-binding protein [Bacillota bacterium]
MFLKIDNLSKYFAELKAVDNFSVQIEKGQFFSILGPSGCGKTTTLKMLGGFLQPDSGAIILDNKDISNKKAEKRPVATVFQNYALFPHMNVIENITYGLKFKDISKINAQKKGLEILDMVGLNNYDEKEISQLSGGEMQRVALARALITNPKLLLLDEPLSNLDAKLRIKMRKKIKELQEELGITMIYVTHDQEEALSLSDQIIVMNKGKIEQIGSPREIYNDPKNKFVADFVGRVNFITIDEKNNLFRPENIELSINNGDLRGEITQKQFRGSFTTYFVKSNNNLIQVDVMNSNDDNWQVGKNIYLKF